MMNHLINQLIQYGIQEDILNIVDRDYAVNQLLYLLKLDHFDREEITEPIDFFSVMPTILTEAYNKGLIPSDSIQDFDHFEAKLMDALMPRPSQMDQRFRQLYKKAPVYATNDFYRFSQKTNYIKTERIKKNIHFVYEGKYAPLDISINLSKPEKDPKKIALQSKIDENNYPKCALCMENVGFFGDENHASRSNHRVITLTINHEKDQWGFQYSPYSYFNEHAIILKKDHIPMHVNVETLNELVDFVNQFPHYTIGSNAGLPIVGGSILNHYHFQGGKADFPIEKARVLREYKVRKTKVEILDWPMSVIRVSGGSEFKVLDVVTDILNAWKNYNNPDLNIYAKTNDEEHNTITPILTIKEGKYQFYIILRNNLTTEERPYGVFHPREEYFHIKKENIGLIEVMGLAILPGRLMKELDEIKKVLSQNHSIDQFPDLEKHESWIEAMKKEKASEENISQFLYNQVGMIFEKVLEDCGVFKAEDKHEFFRFIEKTI